TSSATTTTSSTTTTTSSGGPVCMTSMSSCFGCEGCANGDGGACAMAHDACQNDTTDGCAAVENCVLSCADPTCIKTTCMPEAGALFTNWVACYCHQCGSAMVCNAVFQVFCADAGP